MFVPIGLVFSIAILIDFVKNILPAVICNKDFMVEVYVIAVSFTMCTLALSSHTHTHTHRSSMDRV